MRSHLTGLHSMTLLAIGCALMVSCGFNSVASYTDKLTKSWFPQKDQTKGEVWKEDLRSEVQALGYRNWIVIADAAFPFHNRVGVRTVVAPVETPEIVRELVATINEKQHIKPQFYTARELQSVKNSQAPGVDQFRKELKSALSSYPSRKLDSITLNRLLQGTSNTYAVLVIKTQTALPYSSVFIELDSGYWDIETEQELRENIKKKEGSTSTTSSDRVSDLVSLF